MQIKMLLLFNLVVSKSIILTGITSMELLEQLQKANYDLQFSAAKMVVFNFYFNS